MRIILDVMGADNAPKELIHGAILAKKEYENCDITLVGDESIIREALASEGEKTENFSIVHCEDFVTMEDDPMSIRTTHAESSMVRSLKMLAGGEGDAVISCGNTGALFTGATLIVRRIRGIRRAALGSVLPFNGGTLLLDSGANAVVTSEQLVQFAYLGSIYMEKVMGIKNPRIGLLNNGAEEHKGTPTVSETHKILAKASGINFIGNIEGKDIPFGACDVIICDGFTGNIALKTTEGVAKFVMKEIKKVFADGIVSKIAGLLIKKKLYKMKKYFDATEYGGAPFLGLAKPVIKAHGNSDANAIKNAIRQAINYSSCGAIDQISASQQQIDEAVKAIAQAEKAKENKE